jgi:hypothetical protein
MSPTRVQRLVLAGFPARFRLRYGDELSALISDSGGGWRVTADLVRSAAREWLRPSFIGTTEEQRRMRLQSTTATVFVLWSFSALAVAVFARAVDDHPVPGLHSWGFVAYGAGTVVFELTAGAVLLIGFVYWLRVVLPAVRAHNGAVLVPAVLPIAVGTLWLVTTALVAFIGHHIVPGNYRHITAQAPTTAGGMAVLAVYALFTLACVVMCASSVVRALTRAALPTPLLRGSMAVAAAVAAALGCVASAASVCLARVLIVGHIDPRTMAMAVGAVAALWLVWVGAATSAMRGVRALRTG